MLVLSQYLEEHYAAQLLADGADGVGYLLKERVGNVDEFVDAAARVAEGAQRGRSRGRRADARSPPGAHGVAQLSPRELEVLAAMAEGKSNRGIAPELVITQAAVEKHITGIFSKLGVDAGETEHRRVHAVLTYLRES